MELSRRQILIYVALAVVVAAVGVRYLLSSHGGGEVAPALTLESLSPPASASPSAGASPHSVVAYVCGEVAHPGVYTLASGARVSDLLECAGGATGKAALEGINLAAPVADGQQVVVPERGAPGSATVTSTGGATGGGTTTGGGAATTSAATGGVNAKVNLNTATLEQLDTLPGVGPSTAQKIVDYREANGGFTSVDQLNDVSGIGEVRFAELKDLVTI